MFGQGKLEKLRLTAYADLDYTNEVYSTELLLNPQTLKENYEIVFNDEQAANSDSSELKFSHILPGELNFQLIFDSTGMFDEYTGNPLQKSFGDFLPAETENLGVMEKVNEFKTNFLDYDGDTHQPKYARFEWGEFSYDCRIKNVEIEFTLFNNQGKPIRAFIRLTAKEVVPPERARLENRPNSPDMTHHRTVKAGDTIQLLTKEIYGDVKYYLAVANANNLLNFRNLKPGQELYFPPIEKN